MLINKETTHETKIKPWLPVNKWCLWVMYLRLSLSYRLHTLVPPLVFNQAQCRTVMIHCQGSETQKMLFQKLWIWSPSVHKTWFDLIQRLEVKRWKLLHHSHASLNSSFPGIQEPKSVAKAKPRERFQWTCWSESADQNTHYTYVSLNIIQLQVTH